MQNLNSLKIEWNNQQKKLRSLLSQPDKYNEATQLFLDQHAVMHSAKIAKNSLWSYEDVLLNDLTDKDFRRLLPKEEHTIAWHIWHITRIEDITMQLLIAGKDQIFDSQGWNEKLKCEVRDTGNAMNRSDIQILSDSIDLVFLREYRLAVGKGTREIIPKIQPEEINTKVKKDRLQRVLYVGAVVPEAIGVIEYWGNRTIAGLLGMPPSRHLMVHLNQAHKLKEKMQG